MKLKTPSAPFSPVFVTGESISIDTSGKVLVLPTGNPSILPSFNEYTLNSNRLTVTESPFGGLKGSGSPDYCPGTLNIISGDGIYLTDINGQNTTKTLTAGKLAELGHLTVDTAAHTITEEFILRNDSEGTDVQVIDVCDSTTGWVTEFGNGTISAENGRIKYDGTTSSNCAFVVSKNFILDLSAKAFLTFDIQSSVSGQCYVLLFDSMNRIQSYEQDARFAFSQGNVCKFVLSLKAPAGHIGAVPYGRNEGFDFTQIRTIKIGIANTAATIPATMYIDNITACNGTWAQVEVAVPDFAKSTGSNYFDIYAHNGTAYETSPAFKSSELKGTVYQANLKMLDGTKAGDMYAATGQFYRGMAVTTLGKRLDQVAKVSPSYQDPNFVTPVRISSNYGTLKRRIIAILIPPSDNGRTGINQCRLKLVTYYDKGIDGHYSSTYEFSNDTNTSTGLQNVINPWIAIIDPSSSEIDFYLFTHRPKNLSFKRNESGQIYEVTLYPGNGLLYHGQIYYSDVTRDTDSNDIPDCLEASLEGSLTKFLQSYGMVI